MEVSGMKTHPMVDPACTRGHHYVRDGIQCATCGAVVAPVLTTMPGLRFSPKSGQGLCGLLGRVE
jgi:hypothetical protein